MTGELIILPVRIGVRVTRFALRTGVHVTGQAVAVAADVVKSVTGTASGTQDWSPPAPEPRAPEPPPPPPPSPEPLVVDADEVVDYDAEPEPEPAHVSEEPELVEALAEPGAEDGAGAEVTVAEPWDGYRQMHADDVIDRVRVATPAELAAVQLYESANRARQTVLSAVRRELRAAENTRKEQADGQ
jgi:hypothetical protein